MVSNLAWRADGAQMFVHTACKSFVCRQNGQVGLPEIHRNTMKPSQFTMLETSFRIFFGGLLWGCHTASSASSCPGPNFRFFHGIFCPYHRVIQHGLKIQLVTGPEVLAYAESPTALLLLLVQPSGELPRERKASGMPHWRWTSTHLCWIFKQSFEFTAGFQTEVKTP